MCVSGGGKHYKVGGSKSNQVLILRYDTQGEKKKGVPERERNREHFISLLKCALIIGSLKNKRGCSGLEQNRCSRCVMLV